MPICDDADLYTLFLRGVNSGCRLTDRRSSMVTKGSPDLPGAGSNTMPDGISTQDPKEAIRLAARDHSLTKLRSELAHVTAETFFRAGRKIHVLGHLIGSDRGNGLSPFGHGSDETVAVSMLLRIASQLVSGSTDMFVDGRTYAAAALLRQMVEIEYLAWAMATREGDGERWLHSDRRQRESFFSPAKLRKAAQGTFRGKDYGYHCELGGHAVPRASVLLDGDSAAPQLLVADMLGHTGRIWDHLADWARGGTNGAPVLTRNQHMAEKFSEWKLLDPLAGLPPPP